MAQAKWLKLGAAAFLSVGMLSACGNEEPVEQEGDIEDESDGFEAPADDLDDEDADSESDAEEEDTED